MRKMVCGECKKRYDYDVDDFCPRCGAYNIPSRKETSIMRIDGINESNHTDSFLHEELHQEKKERRQQGLSKDTLRSFQQPMKQGGAQKKAAQNRRQKPVDQNTGEFDIKKILWLVFLGVAILLEIASS